MSENVPMGAEYDSRAPWNQVENSEIERDCEVTETITRKVTLSTTDYVSEDDWDDNMGKCTYDNTSDTDWLEEYSKLIAKLKSYVEKDIRNASLNTSRERELKRLLSACCDWEQVELEVEEC